MQSDMWLEHICLHIQEVDRFQKMTENLPSCLYNLILFMTQLSCRNNNDNFT